MNRTPTSRRRFLGLAAGLGLTAAAGGLLGGCGRGGQNAAEVVVSFNDLSQPFFVAMRRELEDEAAKLGVKVQVMDAQNNSSKQIADLEAAAVQGAKVVIIAPTDSKALATAADELAEQGVAVISVDRNISGAKVPVPHVGADNVAGGRAMADWVVKTYPGGARVVVITNDPGSSSSIERVKGVHEGLAAGGPAFKIAAEQTANSKRDQALTVTQNVLTSMHDDPPDVILCLNDDMAMGALEAVRAGGFAPGKIKVLGFDAIPEALARIKAGEMVASVEQNPGQQIRTALRQAVAKIKTGAAPKSVSLTPVLITSANLSEASRISEVK
ncbi:sugar ABC transporter substrate-binding protein [Caulobacter sp. BE254]|uniref:sugar ABC transporter substrate-binding protein n=1 Tax=Caulobacter sp. BE254 TaxID=2817720 RepID=UPI00285E7489|nr:sugar ABC transporter substrate-binding protein [Caulobacter sp. BE254]MDR7114631.1 inositol transport system substrate-binding protein [Caulobacter sp. BE254]